MLSRVIAPAAAFTASAALALVPLFAMNATIPSADFPELFFVCASLWMFWLACRRERNFGLLVGAGVAAALAFSAHEVSLALIFFYGLLFLRGYAIPRRRYWIMALGFVAVLGIETAYYWAAVGDPAYRFRHFIRGAGYRDRADVGMFEFTPGGTLHVWDPIDPALMLFTHMHQFGVLALLSLPGLWWALRPSASGPTEAHRTARLLAGLGLVWLLFATFTLTNQQVLPRYYCVTAYCLCVVAALWIWETQRRTRPRFVAVYGVVFALAGITGIVASNTNPRFGERALAEYLTQSTGPVYTDPLTADKTRWYCRWKNVDCGRIVAEPPPSGAVYFYNPKNADHANRLVKPDRVAMFKPAHGWSEILRREEPQRALVVALAQLGVIGLLPQRIRQKLTQPNPPVAVYRVAS
jgi:4-amino-4-deoxy-L-arabinose transferase-like glycosyltransferase